MGSSYFPIIGIIASLVSWVCMHHIGGKESNVKRRKEDVLLINMGKELCFLFLFSLYFKFPLKVWYMVR